MSGLVLCGCGRHHVREGAKGTVVWDGSTWDAACAFEEAKRELEAAPTKDELRNIIARVPCHICDHPVGRGYEVLGHNVYHQACLHDHGGEEG